MLIQLMDEYGVVKEGAIEIEQLPTQQELAEMAGTSYPIQDKGPVASFSLRKQAEKVIRDVRDTQSSFWNL